MFVQSLWELHALFSEGVYKPLVIHYIHSCISRLNKHFWPKLGTSNLWAIFYILLIHILFAPLSFSSGFSSWTPYVGMTRISPSRIRSRISRPNEHFRPNLAQVLNLWTICYIPLIHFFSSFQEYSYFKKAVFIWISIIRESYRTPNVGIIIIIIIRSSDNFDLATITPNP